MTVSAAGGPSAAASTGTTPTASPPARSTAGLAPHGEGAAGDRVIQAALEKAWPADLPAGQERELLAAGRDLLRADATGIGRIRWPTVFPDPHRGIAPGFAAARFRIQAAIARRAGRPDKVVVHLVWAGADRGGTYTDLRLSDWYFTRTHTKGAPVWAPQQPRT
ncbi:hypothetical protein OG866_00275 [Streptomyces sp. NBC_00663]|uniref:hypothetical protein n=1 Tax=Streptomyces sp. NBC_00663 TaxID=2975801 RepID=UPI002E327B7D|nr:hypothetical protein [Streptomyces sp. NBC_00663]